MEKEKEKKASFMFFQFLLYNCLLERIRQSYILRESEKIKDVRLLHSDLFYGLITSLVLISLCMIVICMSSIVSCGKRFYLYESKSKEKGESKAG